MTFYYKFTAINILHIDLISAKFDGDGVDSQLLNTVIIGVRRR